jgi:hypothetical protein
MNKRKAKGDDRRGDNHAPPEPAGSSEAISTPSGPEVVALLSDIARRTMGDFVTIGADGQVRPDLEKAESLGKLHLIKRLDFAPDGSVASIELIDPIGALALLGRFHGLWRDHLTVEVADSGEMLKSKILDAFTAGTEAGAAN